MRATKQELSIMNALLDDEIQSLAGMLRVDWFMSNYGGVRRKIDTRWHWTNSQLWNSYLYTAKKILLETSPVRDKVLPRAHDHLLPRYGGPSQRR